ncbi:MAG TPA: hypothetical protein VN923_17785 [Thermoanaerobaculia bacterium]|nr:hypothetical protein [Thermoanaerobaculia bacterium]
MKRFLCLLSACGAGVLLGAAVPAFAAGDEGELARLISPATDASLKAGEDVTLAWEAGSGLSAMPHAEEWEAFLSLDGGRTFLTRLTPHLELEMRRVTVRLPELPSDDARLLLRFGDESEEREQVMPGQFRIVAGDAPALTWRLPRLGRGESARPGDPGVLVWVEGSRDGEGWEECEGERAGDVWEPAFVHGAVRLRGLGPMPSPSPKLVRAALAAIDSQVVDTVPAGTPPTYGAKTPRLSVLCRRNV